MTIKQKTSIVLGFVAMLSLVAFFGPKSPAFSTDSLKKLETLNQMYDVELYAFGHQATNDMLTASLESSQTNNSQNLVATLKGDVMEVYMIKPKRPLSKNELSIVAKSYSEIPEFEFVEIDQRLELSSVDEMEQIHRAKINNTIQESDPIRIGIFDSGLDESHPIFNNSNIQVGWDAIENKVYNGVDEVGHGTHVAGIIAKEITSAEIIPYKIVDAEGGRLSNLVLAMQKALEEGELDIMNMSFGFEESSEILKELINEASEKGIVMVAAAGNKESDEPFYPAYYEKVIAVGAATRKGNTLSTSNFGTWVDVAALGHYVQSAAPNSSYTYKSGTSQATAFATSYIAQLLKKNEVASTSAQDITQALNDIEEKVVSGKLKGLSFIE